MSEMDKLLEQLGEVNKVEWFESDAAYDIVQNDLLIDQYGNMISKDRGTDIIY